LDTGSAGSANLIPQKHKPVGGFGVSCQFCQNQHKQPTKTKNLRIRAGEAWILVLYYQLILFAGLLLYIANKMRISLVLGVPNSCGC